MPESTDEESGKDAAGFREVCTEKEHTAEGLPQEPTARKVCHSVRQVHKVVSDEVGDCQVNKEDLISAYCRFLSWQGAYG